MQCACILDFDSTIFFCSQLYFQGFECRNHIRVIQSMENGNRLYICGTNAHNPKDYVIYVSIIRKRTFGEMCVCFLPYLFSPPSTAPPPPPPHSPIFFAYPRWRTCVPSPNIHQSSVLLLSYIICQPTHTQAHNLHTLALLSSRKFTCANEAKRVEMAAEKKRKILLFGMRCMQFPLVI